MTKDVITVTPEQTVEECMELMTKGRFRHLPVLKDGMLTGVISIGDVVKEMISNREAMIAILEDYIQGRGYGH
jgi:CBS domain-containing protein